MYVRYDFVKDMFFEIFVFGFEIGVGNEWGEGVVFFGLFKNMLVFSSVKNSFEIYCCWFMS